MNAVKDRLKFAREMRGWTQVHLAVVAGVSKATVGMTESGKRTSKGSLYAIAKALGVRYEWLYAGEGEMLEPIPLADMDDDVTRQVKQLEIMLRSVHAAGRKDAFLAAAQAMIVYLPAAKPPLPAPGQLKTPPA